MPVSKSADADALRAALLRVADDPAALRPLCRDNADAIRRHFVSWLNVPEVLKERPDLLKPYAQGLAAVAGVFADDLGDPSLMQQLNRPSDEDPTPRWDAALKQARQDMAVLRLADAVGRLTDLALEVGQSRDGAADAYVPVVLATLGECFFQAGQHDRALEATRQALEGFRKRNGDEGAEDYLGSLYEIHRYRGESEEAANCADQFAEALERRGRAAEAARYRKQARLVRAGEPLLRVVLDVGGNRYELDEALQGVEGPVRFLFERNRRSLAPSDALTRRGMQESNKGRHREALPFFEQAIKADPLNPEPVYESARTLLLLGRAAEAVERYDRTETLAPGWFHCRSEGWLARQIALGRYPVEVYLNLRAAQEGPLEQAVRTQLAAHTVKKYPGLAPLHHLYGRLMVEAQQQAAAVSAFRQGLECAEEPDIRTRLLVDLASAITDDAERRELCEEALALGGNLVAAATAAVVLTFG
jgi:tetratricopeptide (TPR) repeat protein